MSFFSIFGNKRPREVDALPEPSGLDSKGSTQPTSPVGGRKSVRLGQRELLYTVVRDVMIRAGVLVASYRFKVLSLDAQGRQYLIMMDLLKIDVGEMKRLSEIESMIVQAAKVRHDILVTGVYWRNDLEKTHVKTPQTQVSGSTATLAKSRSARTSPASKDFGRKDAEPMNHTLTSVQEKKPVHNRVVSSGKSHRPSPDFEETRIVEPNEYGSQLSATQYGDLE